MPIQTAEEALSALLPQWRELLQHWSASGQLTAAAQEALLLDGVPTALRRLTDEWASGNFGSLPPIELLSSHDISGALGAYAISTGTIYLNRDWLQTASQEQVLAVLTEELGHHLDGVLNPADTPGDEGELFAALLSGNGRISLEQQQRLRNQQDQGQLWLEQKPLAVEQAAVVSSTPIRPASPGRTSGEWRNGYAFAVLKSDGSVVTWGDSSWGGDSSAVSTRLASGVTQIFSTNSAFAALKSDGSVVTWGDSYRGGDSSAVSTRLASGVTQIFSTYFAFAALKSDGSVVTWGVSSWGGDSRAVSTRLASGVTQIFSTDCAFAALKSDGSVVTWGDSSSGGDSSAVSTRLASGVTQIFSTGSAFAALKSDGSVVTWGSSSYGGDSSAVSTRLASGVTQIFSTGSAFAALKSDGSVVTWGSSFAGGDSSAVSTRLASGVTQIFSTGSAFAALKSDGSVVTWGVSSWGGDIRAVSTRLASGVTQIFSTGSAFAALKSDGSVVTWGSSSDGGDSSAVATRLASGVTQIFSTNYAFAALKSDGSVVTWGDSSYGGDSSAVSTRLSSGVVSMANPFTDDRLLVPENLPAITLSVAPTTVAEDGTATVLYTFSRSGPTDTALTVNYTVSGTATAGIDYSGFAASGSAGTITFAAGSSSATLSLDPTADILAESNETVVLSLAAGSGYSIGTPAVASASISNDDLPAISLSVAPTAVAEDGTATVLYTFSRSGPTDTALTVNYTVSGTATPGSDYSGLASTGSSQTITFAAGSSSTTLRLDPSPDTTVESDETVALTLAPSNSYNVTTSSAVSAAISNDDTNVSLSVSPVAVTEDGSASLVYTFLRTGVLSTALSINFSVVSTAIFGVDYSQSGATTFSGTGGTVQFSAGSSTTMVSLDPIADSNVEANQTIALSLQNGPGYTTTSTAAVGTLNNDDQLEAGVTVVPISGNGLTSEAGGRASYSFVLNRQPTDSVVLNFTISDSSEASLDRASITFTASNWNIPQALSITGLDDFDDDGDIPYGIATRISSADPDYGPRLDGTGGVLVPNLQLVNLDDSQDGDLTLYGDNGGGQVVNDELQGLNGQDRVYGLLGRDRLRGGRNDDRLYGGIDDDSLWGDDGNDQLFGEQDDDILEGGTGDDRLTGGEGSDRLIGGAGNDLYVLDDELDTIDDRGLASDVDSVLIRGNLRAYTLAAGIDNATLEGTQAEDLTGNAGNNSLTGNANANNLVGAAGNDILYAADGDDNVDGGGGDDLIIGGDGLGDDVYVGGSGRDTVRYSSASRFPIQVNLNTGTASGREIGSDLLSSIEDVIGGSKGDTITGSAADNRLIGGPGADRLSGNGGSDTFAYTSLKDATVTAKGRDTINDFQGSGSASDRLDLSALDANNKASGNQAFRLIGSRAFSGRSGELRFADGLLSADVNGDRKADFAIALSDLTVLNRELVLL